MFAVTAMQTYVAHFASQTILGMMQSGGEVV